jgi:hypothetical protein
LNRQLNPVSAVVGEDANDHMKPNFDMVMVDHFSGLRQLFKESFLRYQKGKEQ